MKRSVVYVLVVFLVVLAGFAIESLSTQSPRPLSRAEEILNATVSDGVLTDSYGYSQPQNIGGLTEFAFILEAYHRLASGRGPLVIQEQYSFDGGRSWHAEVRKWRLPINADASHSSDGEFALIQRREPKPMPSGTLARLHVTVPPGATTFLIAWMAPGWWHDLHGQDPSQLVPLKTSN